MSFFDSGEFVAAEIVHDDDISRFEDRHKLQNSSLALPENIATRSLGQPYAVNSELFSVAIERGTTLHQALHILMDRPDMRQRLIANTALDEESIERVELQAKELTAYLHNLGCRRIFHEVPFVYVNESGSNVSAVIACLTEGDDGLAIIDHKSDLVQDFDVRFAAYWPQLSAYVEAV